MPHVDITNLIVMAVAIAIAASIPAMFPRLPLPGVVLEIVIGALVGPQVPGWVHPQVTLNFLANLGLGVLFLMAGFEMDPIILRGKPIKRAVIGWFMTVVLALVAALLLLGAGLAASPVLCALALTTTAIGALMPVLRDSQLLGPPYGPVVLAAGAIGEAAPVIALSLILANGRAPEQSGIMLAFAGCILGVLLLVARFRDGYIAGVVARTMESSGQLPMRIAICTLILLAVLAQQLDIDLVLGAFAAGAIVRAGLTEEHQRSIALRLDGIGSAFLVPIFFVTSGVRLDVAALFSDWEALAMVPVYAVLMLLTRGVPAMVLYRDILDRQQRMALALHLGTQISLVVAITGIAVQRGLMPGSQAAALVGGGIVTTILFPALAKQLLSTRRDSRLTMAGTLLICLWVGIPHASEPNNMQMQLMYSA